jgi:hypothetical protein
MHKWWKDKVHYERKQILGKISNPRVLYQRIPRIYLNLYEITPYLSYFDWALICSRETLTL